MELSRRVTLHDIGKIWPVRGGGAASAQRLGCPCAGGDPFLWEERHAFHRVRPLCTLAPPFFLLAPHPTMGKVSCTGTTSPTRAAVPPVAASRFRPTFQQPSGSYFERKSSPSTPFWFRGHLGPASPAFGSISPLRLSPQGLNARTLWCAGRLSPLLGRHRWDMICKPRPTFLCRPVRANTARHCCCRPNGRRDVWAGDLSLNEKGWPLISSTMLLVLPFKTRTPGHFGACWRGLGLYLFLLFCCARHPGLLALPWCAATERTGIAILLLLAAAPIVEWAPIVNRPPPSATKTPVGPSAAGPAAPPRAAV